MLQQYLMQQEDVVLGWGFFGPLVMMVVLIIMTMSFFRWLKEDYPEAGLETSITVDVGAEQAPAAGDTAAGKAPAGE